MFKIISGTQSKSLIHLRRIINMTREVLQIINQYYIKIT
jgi:hypothetical protein